MGRRDERGETGRVESFTTVVAISDGPLDLLGDRIA
jgi:hypothetical protein